MEDDCEDDEVVLEDSQLHKYLEEIGIDSSEYECIPRLKLPATEEAKPSYWKKWFSPVTKMPRVIREVSKRNRSAPDISLEQQCCSEYVKLLQNTEVLTEDDANFLNDCVSSVGQNDASVLHFKTHLKLTIGRLVIPGVALAACLVECLLATSSGLVWAVESATASGLAIYCTMEAASVWSSSRKSWQHINNTAGLKALIKSCEAFNDLLKKVVRLIQELEIVARGFTLVLPSTPVEKLELSSLPMYRTQQQCPALRVTAFHAAKDVAVAFQEATLQLLRKYDLKSSFDHHSHYVASLPLSQFDPLFASEATSAAKDPQMDNYSLSSIKAIWQLSCLLQSEYLRRLGLCLCPELHVKGTAEGLSVFYNLLSRTTVLVNILETKAEAVKQSYQFHMSVGITSSKSAECGHYKKESHQPESKSHRLQLATHSLSLHLQSALTRVANLESDLELNEISGAEGIYDCLSHQLQSVKAELEACESCLDESTTQLDILCGKIQAKQMCHKWSSNLEVSDVPDDAKHKPIPLFELGDPVVEDQVFEAYVSSDADSQSSSEEDDFVSDARANMEKYNQEKENSRKMFKELKSILTMKAHEWKEREAKALKRANPDKDPVISEDKKDITDSDSGQYLSSPGNTETSTDSAELLSGKSDFECDKDLVKGSSETARRPTKSPLSLDDNDTSVTANVNYRQESCNAIGKDTMASLGTADRSPSGRDLSANLRQNASLGFAANIAAMAAARSLNFDAMANETIHSAEAEEFGSDAESDDSTNQEW